MPGRDACRAVWINPCKENDYKLSANGTDYLKKHLEIYVANSDKYFGNARDVRNFLDIAISAQANRLLEENATDPEALITLEPADLAHIFNKEEDA